MSEAFRKLEKTSLAMSLKPSRMREISEESVEVAHAVFSKGNVYLFPPHYDRAAHPRPRTSFPNPADCGQTTA
jgi:hypothetical protein